jgi:hypothetical protein
MAREPAACAREHVAGDRVLRVRVVEAIEIEAPISA